MWIRRVHSCHEPFEVQSGPLCELPFGTVFRNRATLARDLARDWRRNERPARPAHGTSGCSPKLRTSEGHPHGELSFARRIRFLYRCHQFGHAHATPPSLRSEPIVRRLYERGVARISLGAWRTSCLSWGVRRDGRNVYGRMLEQNDGMLMKTPIEP